MLKTFKFIFLFLVMLILINCNLYSGTAFNLNVLDENGNSVRNAEINGGCGNGNIEGKTDENGKFSTVIQCVFDEGFWFRVKKEGYLEYSEDYGVTYIFNYNQFKDKRIVLKKK